MHCATVSLTQSLHLQSVKLVPLRQFLALAHDQCQPVPCPDCLICVTVLRATAGLLGSGPVDISESGIFVAPGLTNRRRLRSHFDLHQFPCVGNRPQAGASQ